MNGLDRSDEAVGTTGNCFDEPWRVGIAAERGAEPLHRGIQVVLEVDERVVRPQLVAERLARDNLARPLHEQREDALRLVLQPDPRARFSQFAGGPIELEEAEARPPGVLGLLN